MVLDLLAQHRHLAGERADLAIGSRYVPGGGVGDWSMLRRAISRGGSAYARLALGVGVRDLTGGFKCFRREVLEGKAEEPQAVLAALDAVTAEDIQRVAQDIIDEGPYLAVIGPFDDAERFEKLLG